MKELVITIVSLILISCNYSVTENDDELTEFLSAIEASALDINKNIVELNIGYSVIFESTTIEKIGLISKEEVNDDIVTPCIRSIIRSEISNFSKNDIDQINIESVKAKINEQMNSGRIVIGERSLDNCNLAIGLFNITVKN